MSSPFPLDLHVDLFYDGAWNDISSDVHQRQDITMEWGRPNEASQSQSKQLGMSLNNTSENYNPENPNSALFGKIGRNEPIRVRLGASQQTHHGMVLHGLGGNQGADTPDAAALDITGDIDVRIFIEPASWRPPGTATLASKAFTSTTGLSWGWAVLADGLLRFRWYPGGIPGTAVFADSTAAVPEASESLALRVTLDVDNGAAGHNVTFYTAPSMAGPWTQLGAVVTTAGVTSIFSGPGPLHVGRLPAFPELGFLGSIFAFELRNGIGGAVVADPVFTDQRVGDFEFTDSAGNPWTLRGGANIMISDPAVQSAAEVTSWRPRTDKSGQDKYTEIKARGIMQRLGQGEEEIRSSLFRDLSDRASVVAYWPLEEGKDATQFASGLEGDSSVLRPTGEVKLAAYDDFVASAPVPTIGNGYIGGHIPGYVGADNQRLSFLVHVPEGGVAADRILLTCSTSIPHTVWEIIIQASGDLYLRAFDGLDNSLFTTDAFGTSINGQQVVVSLLLGQDGSDIDWSVWTFDITTAEVLVHESGTQVGRTFDRFTSFTMGDPPPVSDMGGIAVGHPFVVNDDVNTVWDLMRNSATAWVGEPAGERILRLLGEERIPVQFVGDPTDTEAMGPQTMTTLLDLLRECEASDLGVLDEMTEEIALRYRTRADLYDQAAVLTIDAAAGQIAQSLEPDIGDDTRNDVTVGRVGGSSSRVVQETGPRNVQDPKQDPQGVGRYKTKVDLSLGEDSQALQQAGWRKHLGTVAGSRFTRVALNLGRDPGLSTAATAVRPGDKITVTNPPAWTGAEALGLLAQGGKVRLSTFKHEIDYVTTPEQPWQVGAVAQDNQADNGPTDRVRLDTDGSEVLAEFVAGTGTSLSVAVTAGPVWGTTDALMAFPFDIRVFGAVLRVTAIADTELAPNGQFETNVAGWSALGGTFTHSTAQAHSGIASGLQTPDGVTAVVRARTDNPIAVIATRQYTFTAWVRSANGRTVDLSVLFRDAGGNQVEFEQWANVAVAAGVWTELTGTRLAPAAAVTAQLNINQRTTPAVTDLLYIDDVSLTGPVQTFTVEQTPINGVTKTIPAGKAVRLAHPLILAL